MQHISFYKDRLPFKPKSNVVIYFDVTGIGMKLYYHVINSANADYKAALEEVLALSAR